MCAVFVKVPTKASLPVGNFQEMNVPSFGEIVDIPFIYSVLQLGWRRGVRVPCVGVNGSLRRRKLWKRGTFDYISKCDLAISIMFLYKTSESTVLFTFA